MNLAQARNYTSHIVKWLGPHLVEYAIAGSVRRDKLEVNDVDIVCIPRATEDKDLLGGTGYRLNHVLAFLQNYVKQTPGARFISGGEKEGKQVLVQLPKCQLDLWFAEPANFASRLLCRTGSMEHNIWLVQHAKTRAMKWSPYEGVYGGGYWKALGEPGEEYIGGELKPATSEEQIYRLLDLPYIMPHLRERDYLVKTYGA